MLASLVSLSLELIAPSWYLQLIRHQ